MSRAAGIAWAVVALASLAPGCEVRERPARGPDHADVAPILERACVECHGPARAEAGYRVDGYAEVTGCPEGAPPSAVEPPGPEAPILAAQSVDPHVGLLDETERALLAAWVAAGAPASVGGAHPAGWTDPRSDGFHGRALRRERWARMLDPAAPGACAGCHGASATEVPDAGLGPAPGATECATCHRDEGGPFACSTCHGTPGRAFPPRDPCRHPEDAEAAGAHAAHAGAGVGCAVCHGERTIEALADGAHGDGLVQVALDPARAGAGASWDPLSRTCNGTCHARGGELPSPAWAVEVGLTCASCHATPPPDHYAGTCDACHAEASPAGDALAPGPLHANGRVDLGDGGDGCGACHGAGDDPTPETGSHPAHAEPSLSLAFECGECHEVPSAVDAAGHLDRTPGAEVRFGARALARGATPAFDGASCAGTACHGDATPSWGAGPAAAACGSCHGVPPAPPHPAGSTCGASRCHTDLVGPGPALTPAGVETHVDGRVDPWAASSSP